MKILIGYDGSECADAALEDLSRAGLPSKAEAFILSVAERWIPPQSSSGELLKDQTRSNLAVEVQRDACHAASAMLALAERARDRIVTNFPDWRVTAHSSCGSPAWELVAKADEWKPDLVVVGSHGRNALGRFVLGSVSQRVLTEARGPVRVSRRRVIDSNSPVKIIVGSDGSEASDEALRAVAARNWPPQSEVMVILVVDQIKPVFLERVIPPLREMFQEDQREDRAWIENISSRSVELLRGTDVAVSCAVREGDPRKELCKAADEWGADCIFVGSTGFSNEIERFVLGSVSAAVAARAHCSVEVVRKRSP